VSRAIARDTLARRAGRRCAETRASSRVGPGSVWLGPGERAAIRGAALFVAPLVAELIVVPARGVVVSVRLAA